MTVVTKHINHLKAMKNSVEDVLREVLTKKSEQVVNLVKYGQLEQGINSYGKVIGTYSLSTQGYANADKIRTKKPFGQPYNMYWSGETVDNLKFKLKPKTYEIFTIAGKQRLLEGIYGEIFDLTKEHNNYVNKEILEPELVKWINENWWKAM